MNGNYERAIELLTTLYIMCMEAGNFSNGVTALGADEGEVLARRQLREVERFLTGKNDDFDTYRASYNQHNDVVPGDSPPF